MGATAEHLCVGALDASRDALIGAVWTGEPAFTCLCADPGSGPSERGEHRPIKWDRRVCRGFVFYPGGSAVWP